MKYGYEGTEISIHAPREGSDMLQRLEHWLKRKHFYPRSPRGERLPVLCAISCKAMISIHAPREGSDLDLAVGGVYAHPISIHAPREGSDYCRAWSAAAGLRFLSTLPARGATCPAAHGRRLWRYFYPRSPRGERRWRDLADAGLCVQFLSTLPARGATSAYSKKAVAN